MADGILIVGAGGLAREVAAALEASSESVHGFVVEAGYPLRSIAGLHVRDDPEIWSAHARFAVAIGKARARSRVVEGLARRVGGARFAIVRHPAALVGPRVTIGDGSLLIGALSITVDVEIGRHVLVNPGCTIAHDCCIHDFANLGPAVSLAGGVVVEKGAEIGTGAVVAPRCRIGAWAVVGAGAVVIRDVSPGSTVVGVPARPLTHSSKGVYHYGRDTC